MTTQELLDLIEGGEGPTVEFKRQIDSALDIAAEIVAFANTEGGTLLLGVDDDQNVTSLEDPTLTERRIVGICRDSVLPAIVPQIEAVAGPQPDQAVLVVRIPRGPDRPYRTKTDHYYIRAGSTKRRTTKGELARLFQNAGVVHHDLSPVPGTLLADLDRTKLTEYFRQVHSIEMEDLITEVGLERLLANTNILCQTPEGIRATVGGVLFFAKDPAHLIFAAGITAVRYASTEVSEAIVDQKQIVGTIPQVIDQAETFVRIHNLTPSHIEGMRRVDEPQYLDRVVREAIVNAVAHRNYSISGSRIRILIFDDRLEVRSPGRLPNTITLENIRYGVSFIRNQFIVRLLSQHRYIDVLGRGIPMMIRLSKDYCGREPKFEEVGQEFRVTLWPRETT